MTYERIAKLAEERDALLADLESVTNDLRAELEKAIGSGGMSEYSAAKITGVSRTTIRAWMGKS